MGRELLVESVMPASTPPAASPRSANSRRQANPGPQVDQRPAAALLEKIRRCGVVAVLVIDDPRDAVPLARALLAGGINVMELTLRTPRAVEALQRIRADLPEMIAGVGTVLQPAQVKEVSRAGAAFAVAPGTNPRVIAAAHAIGLPFFPGVATPSDIEAAVESGCRVLKFFPAEPSGGLNYLTNMAAPYAHLGLRYLPLGGLTAASLPDYLADPLILAVGGSWLASRPLIRDGDWTRIRTNAGEARRIVDQVRGSLAPRAITRAVAGSSREGRVSRVGQ